VLTTLLDSFVLTAPELAQLISDLESTTCEPWHIRRYLIDVKPPIDGAFGRTRLYTADDLCLVRLAVRLEREGLSAWVVRAVLANHADEIVRAWRSGTASVLAVHGVRGKVIAEADSTRVPTGTTVVPLQPIRRDVSTAIARIRRHNPTIQLFNRRLSVRDVLSEASETRQTW